MLSHDSIYNYYKTNFALMQHHKYSLTELENMMPWEREIYVGLLSEWVKEENERIEKENAKMKKQRGTTMNAQKKLEKDSQYAHLDLDGDGIVTDEELDMDERMMRLENEDKKQDAQRNMAWFALGGMLLYPFAVVLAIWLGLDQGGKILGDMASVYFVSVAAIVAAFYGSQALQKKQINGNFRGSSKTVTDEQQE